MHRLTILVVMLSGCDLPRAAWPDDGSDGAPADAVATDTRADHDGLDAGEVIDAPLDLVPPDVPDGIRQGHVNYALPPGGWQSGVAWIHMIYDVRYPAAPNRVEVDWIRLHAVTSTGAVTLVADGFAAPSSVSWAETHARAPWFGPPHTALTFDRSADVFAAVPGDAPERLTIVGTDRIPLPPSPMAIPAGATHIRLTARIRITGRVLAQAGVDFWIDDSVAAAPGNHVQAGVTDWLTDTGQWEVVTLDLLP